MKQRSRSAAAPLEPALSRRGFLALCASATSGLASGPAPSARAATPAPAPRAGSERDLRWLELGVDGPDGARTRALLFQPMHERRVFSLGVSARSYPALLLLHGVGGAEGLQAWRTRYGLFDRYAELRRPPLTLDGERARFMRPRQLTRLNAELQKQPFVGLVLICPKPPVIHAAAEREAVIAQYCDWLESRLLPSASTLAAVDDTPCLGLVGYASGAPLALEVFARKPHLFRTFGVAQPRLEPGTAPLALRLRQAAAQAGFAGIHLQTTSEHQQRAAVRALHRDLARHGVAATLDELIGPANDASWREAGLLQVLAWHERSLQLIERPDPDAAPIQSDPPALRPPGPPARI
jgi:hypothetical protein